MHLGVRKCFYRPYCGGEEIREGGNLGEDVHLACGRSTLALEPVLTHCPVLLTFSEVTCFSPSRSQTHKKNTYPPCPVISKASTLFNILNPSSNKECELQGGRDLSSVLHSHHLEECLAYRRCSAKTF